MSADGVADHERQVQARLGHVSGRQGLLEPGGDLVEVAHDTAARGVVRGALVFLAATTFSRRGFKSFTAAFWKVGERSET